eukprot:1182965-Prorocentrum_minimum.AAC.2
MKTFYKTAGQFWFVTRTSTSERSRFCRIWRVARMGVCGTAICCWKGSSMFKSPNSSLSSTGSSSSSSSSNRSVCDRAQI